MDRYFEYELGYSLFLAEQEMFDNVLGLSYQYMTENTGLIALNEGVKETILAYIEKITGAIEKVWARFKEIVGRAKDQGYLKVIADKIAKAAPEFSIDNYPEYDINALDNIKIVEMNYEDMKESLDEQNTFIQKYYPNIMKDSNKSLKENIDDIVIKGKKDNVQITGDMLRSMYKTMTDDLPKKIALMENDLKRFNNSTRNIKNMVNTISSAETTTEAYLIYESYIYEEAEEKDDGKPKIKDNPDAQKKVTLTKHVSNYCKVSTDIISAKLKNYKDIFNFYMMVIKHYAKPPKPEENNEK